MNRQMYRLKSKIKHKLDRTLLKITNRRFCAWCDRIVKRKPYNFRCTECQAEYTVLRNEESEQDAFEDYMSNYEDMRNDLD